MLDLVLRGGRVCDGSGRPAHDADVGIEAGRVVAVGRLDAAARRTLDAHGLIVTPGFVDVHTHYDAQVTWGDRLSPSSWNGVTTVLLGNCGVGFA
ncbi:MAG TPA: amidohydrolase family protein, partial [Verrucomicrobiae bacterium]|nr:amidohydrolase family protein [Verrucomicrobiae bacterium]